MEKGEANSILTSFNRNFPRRNDGNASTLAFIGSPEMVIALGLAGRLTFNPATDSLTAPDGGEVRLVPPAKAPDLPASGFVHDRSATCRPAADGARVDVSVAPGSERLQLLEPFPAWDGADFVDLPVLLKAKGKCTTDHISPAGPWLRYRGHLDRISDNMFIGATNAFTGEVGHGRNLSVGRDGRAVPDDRPRLQGARARVGSWWGTRTTGREAAASTPRCPRGSSARRP